MYATFFIVMTLMIGTTAASPHKFEDGFVERSVGIVVRNDVAEIRYAVGLNDQTIDQLVKQWQHKSPEAAKTKTVQADTSKKSDVSKSTDATNQTLATGQVLTPEQRVANFTAAWKHALAKDLQIEWAGKAVQIEKIEIEPAPRHPYRVILRIKLKLPAAEDARLKIIDNSFAKQTGAVRYALKAAGDSLLLHSNVAPIVVRSERVELKGLDADKRRTVTTVQARLSIVVNPTK